MLLLLYVYKHLLLLSTYFDGVAKRFTSSDITACDDLLRSLQTLHRVAPNLVLRSPHILHFVAPNLEASPQTLQH
jgi:hypothetical protein